MKKKMAKHGCHKMVLDESKYSSAMPVIGLYILGATLVCFLFMLYDIISGFRRKKHWLPCRLFSLNSVTLTLIAIAAKIPVDLTTSMPSALDQFSKLTGTTIICTSMAVLLPSVGSTRSSDSLTNMASLSIFVVTVVVDICIQIRTRLIVLFIPEHIIIMCCMLLLLFLLWDSALAIKSHKDVVLDAHKDLLTKFPGSLLRRLKFAYMCGYTNNPQFLLCKYLSHTLVSPLCIICLVVIIQAASRFLSLEFCRGFSQYDWSIWIIVVTQVLTITLGAFAINFRRFALFLGDDDLLGKGPMSMKVFNDEMYSNPLLRQDLRDRCKHYAVDLPIFVVRILLFIVLHSVGFLVRVFLMFFLYEEKFVPELEEYNHVTAMYWETDWWSLVKSADDMKRWMEGISKSASLHHMLQLLLKTPPSTRTLEHTNTMEIKDELHPDRQGIKVTSLSLVVLVRIAQVSIPSKLSASLVEAYSESHEIIHFIFDNVNSVTLVNRKISQLAQAVWRGDDFSRLLPELFEKYSSSSVTHLMEFDRARVIIKELPSIFDKFNNPEHTHYENTVCLDGAIDVITDSINRREYSSIEDLYNYIEQLFVDMLHMIIAQLPVAIFKYVTESPAEEMAERVKLGLKFPCQVEPLEAHIRWLYPAQGNISSLTTTSDIRTDSGNISSLITTRDIRTDSRDLQEITGDGNVSSLITSDIRIDSRDRQEVTSDGNAGEISVC